MPHEGFLKIVFGENSDEPERRRTFPFADSELYRVRIKGANNLTQGEHVKDVYDIALDTQDVTHPFQPGDTIGVLPSNNPQEVNDILKRFVNEDVHDERCSIILLDAKKSRSVLHLPLNTTLRKIFMTCVDIRAPPKKTFLKILAEHTEDPGEKDNLVKLSSPSNSEDYITFISNTGRRLLDILQTFQSCKVPIERLLENLPPLQPRPYSISSSPLLQNELHITFSVEYFDHPTIKGVCSGWLENMILSHTKGDGHHVQFYFRKPNLFRFNPNSSNPTIMIGPGTGVAPFVGFLQHLFLAKKDLNTWLFCGCRYKDRDYLYKKDLEKYLEEGYLTKLSVAFSRDQDMKIYVQDLIKNEPGQIYEKLVEEGGVVYVCGDLKDMMSSVKGSIKYCLVNNGMSEEEADLFISNMIKTNRYIEDKWI